MEYDIPSLLALFEGMPRQGPGNEAATLRALAAAGPLPQEPVVLDLGCGSGASTLVLARELGAPVLAVDLLAPLLERLEAAARDAGLPHLIKTKVGDMAEPGAEPASVDLIWCEGAAYNIGLPRALAVWWELLRPGGRLVVSEMCWLRQGAPEAARSFWADAYPGMIDAAGNLELARRTGFTVLEHFPLERAAWEEFYAPMGARVAELAPRAARDPALAAVLEETRTEMKLFREAGDYYGYLFMVLAKPA